MPVMKLTLGDGPIDYASAKRFAFVAAMLKIICTILLIIIIVIRSTSRGVDLKCTSDCDSYAALSTLDPCCMRQDWQERSRYSWLSFGFDFMEFSAAFIFITPMLALSDVWGRRITTNKLMVSAFVASAAISLLEFLFRAGLTTTTNWLASFSAMQSDQPIQMLTIAYRVVAGQSTWAFAADDLFLGIGLLSSSYLTFRYGQLPRGHAYVGLFTGSLSIISFGLELARFGDWQTLSVISSIVYAVVGFVALPIWLLYLACYLGDYAAPDNRQSLTSDISLPAPAAFGSYSDVEDAPIAGRSVADVDDAKL